MFLQYLIALSSVIFAFIIIIILCGSLALQYGILLPANFSDTKLNQIEQTLRVNFDKKILPPYCSYIIIDHNNKIVDSDMSKKDMKKTSAYLSNGEKSYYDFYKIIPQENADRIIIKYDLLVHFRNPLLHKIIPYPEIFSLGLLFFFIVLSVILTASKFSKKLKQNLVPILSATKKIQEQDLNFEIQLTQISDFNAVLKTIDQLKSALSCSLKKQWDQEQQKNLQLSALAHDIKTPLTVIKGNAELLFESNLTKMDRQMIAYIQSGSDTIDNYLDLLMYTVNSTSLRIVKSTASLNDFLRDACNEAQALCRVKNITLIQHISTECDSIYADCLLLKRAIINIIDNAICYSESNSQIELSVSQDTNALIFDVTDCGKGFSENSLKMATQEFFTEDLARTNHHYGLGLSFAKSVAEMHRGSLSITNHAQAKGATVSIRIMR